MAKSHQLLMAVIAIFLSICAPLFADPPAEETKPEAQKAFGRLFDTLGKRAEERKYLEETPLDDLKQTFLEFLTSEDRELTLAECGDIFYPRFEDGGKRALFVYQAILEESGDAEKRQTALLSLLNEAKEELFSLRSRKEHPDQFNFVNLLAYKLLFVDDIPVPDRMEALRAITKRVKDSSGLIGSMAGIYQDATPLERAQITFNTEELERISYQFGITLAKEPDNSNRLKDARWYQRRWNEILEDQIVEKSATLVINHLRIARLIEDEEWINETIKDLPEGNFLASKVYAWMIWSGNDEAAHELLKERAPRMFYGRLDKNSPFFPFEDPTPNVSWKLEQAQQFADETGTDQYQAFARLFWALSADEARSNEDPETDPELEAAVRQFSRADFYDWPLLEQGLRLIQREKHALKFAGPAYAQWVKHQSFEEFTNSNPKPTYTEAEPWRGYFKSLATPEEIETIASATLDEIRNSDDGRPDYPELYKPYIKGSTSSSSLQYQVFLWPILKLIETHSIDAALDWHAKAITIASAKAGHPYDPKGSIISGVLDKIPPQSQLDFALKACYHPAFANVEFPLNAIFREFRMGHDPALQLTPKSTIETINRLLSDHPHRDFWGRWIGLYLEQDQYGTEDEQQFSEIERLAEGTWIAEFLSDPKPKFKSLTQDNYDELYHEGMPNGLRLETNSLIESMVDRDWHCNFSHLKDHIATLGRVYHSTGYWKGKHDLTSRIEEHRESPEDFQSLITQLDSILFDSENAIHPQSSRYFKPILEWMVIQTKQVDADQLTELSENERIPLYLQVGIAKEALALLKTLDAKQLRFDYPKGFRLDQTFESTTEEVIEQLAPEFPDHSFFLEAYLALAHAHSQKSVTKSPFESIRPTSREKASLSIALSQGARANQLLSQPTPQPQLIELAKGLDSGTLNSTELESRILDHFVTHPGLGKHLGNAIARQGLKLSKEESPSISKVDPKNIRSSRLSSWGEFLVHTRSLSELESLLDFLFADTSKSIGGGFSQTDLRSKVYRNLFHQLASDLKDDGIEKLPEFLPVFELLSNIETKSNPEELHRNYHSSLVPSWREQVFHTIHLKSALLLLAREELESPSLELTFSEKEQEAIDALSETIPINWNYIFPHLASLLTDESPEIRLRFLKAVMKSEHSTPVYSGHTPVFSIASNYGLIDSKTALKLTLETEGEYNSPIGSNIDLALLYHAQGQQEMALQHLTAADEAFLDERKRTGEPNIRLIMRLFSDFGANWGRARLKIDPPE